MSKKYIPALVTFVFFLSIFSVGQCIYKDFGVSWDEPEARVKGAISILFANHKLDGFLFSPESERFFINNMDEFNREKYNGPGYLLNYHSRDHGVSFELLVSAIQYFTRTENPREIYHQRHLINFLFFFLSLFFFYLVNLELFKNYKIAILGCLLFILTPRIFAESFYNPKDLPFLSGYIISIFTLIKFIRHKTWKWALIHAFTCAFAIDIRVPGIILVPITFLFIIWEEVNKNIHPLPRRRWNGYVLFPGAFILFVILFWPLLWEDPAYYFWESFKSLARFRQKPDDMYFFGRVIDSADLPWYYIPGWMTVTIPLPYSLAFLIGFFYFMVDIIKSRFAYKTITQRTGWMVFASFVGPLAAVIVLNSVLYNGWRQLYFIYPVFLLISVSGLIYVYRSLKNLKQRIRRAAGVVMLFFVAHLVYSMIDMHPFQHDYFNILAGDHPEKQFDVDYWGLATKQGLEYILNKDNRSRITVHVPHNPTYLPLKANLDIMDDDDKKRIIVSDSLQGSNYLLMNTTEMEKRGTGGNFDFSAFEEVYAARCRNASLLKIYKQK